MINLEQVKLLETKVAKALDYIEQLARENAGLVKNESEQQAKLETYQKRIDELEDLVMRLKEDQGRIEDSILAALDRLNQFEEAIEKSLWTKPARSGSRAARAQREAAASADAASDEKICFEIPSAENLPAEELAENSPPEGEGGDIPDPLNDTLIADGQTEKNGELDIF